jgi:hypothetical protein
MDLKMLQDYNNWVDKSPEDIVNAVKKKEVGGWAKVFPDKLPLWAHRVRNYFNAEAKSLLRLDESTSKNLLALIQQGLNSLNHDPGFFEDVAETFALSGDVYKDAQGKIWFQMSPGGTIYHWGRDPIVPKPEAFFQGLKGQAGLPIFKLVSPDGTGGSHETILRNPNHWPTVVKKVNFLAYVEHLVNKDYWHQGSYNFSETVIVGNAAHERHDVKPHKQYPYEEVYHNPENRYLPLAERRFPRNDARGNPFAKMN